MVHANLKRYDLKLDVNSKQEVHFYVFLSFLFIYQIFTYTKPECLTWKLVF